MKPPAVLIVEDDEWLAEQHARVLEIAGYRAATTLHALSAIQAIDTVHPDVIVLDILLTGNTGFALLHELQSYGDTGGIPVVLCTNLANELSIDNLSPYGVKSILDKSKMVPNDLIKAVRDVLS